MLKCINAWKRKDRRRKDGRKYGKKGRNIKIKVSIIYRTFINKNLKDKSKNIFGNCIDFIVVFQIVLRIICPLFCSLLSIADFCVVNPASSPDRLTFNRSLRREQGQGFYYIPYSEFRFKSNLASLKKCSLKNKTKKKSKLKNSECYYQNPGFFKY